MKKARIIPEMRIYFLFERRHANCAACNYRKTSDALKLKKKKKKKDAHIKNKKEKKKKEKPSEDTPGRGALPLHTPSNSEAHAKKKKREPRCEGAPAACERRVPLLQTWSNYGIHIQ